VETGKSEESEESDDEEIAGGTQENENSELDHNKHQNEEPTNADKTLKELEEKYLSVDAVDNIRLEIEDEIPVIYFDIKCETDISKSVNEYNGIEIRYNKICDIAPIDEKYDEKIEQINENVLNLHRENYFKI